MGDNCMWKHVEGSTQAPAPKAKAKAKAKDASLAQSLGETPTMISKLANARSNGGSRTKRKF